MPNQTQQENPLDGLLGKLADIICSEVSEIGKEKLLELLHKHKTTIAIASAPVTLAATTCPAGQVWDGKQCVTAPVPPDPTHPGP